MPTQKDPSPAAVHSKIPAQSSLCIVAKVAAELVETDIVGAQLGRSGLASVTGYARDRPIEYSRNADAD